MRDGCGHGDGGAVLGDGPALPIATADRDRDVVLRWPNGVGGDSPGREVLCGVAATVDRNDETERVNAFETAWS